MSNVTPIRQHQPPTYGTIHVWANETGDWEVLHEGRHGDSWSLLDCFPADQRAAAIFRAVLAETEYGPCSIQVREPSS